MNKQIIKSILTNARLRLVAATCLILAGIGPPNSGACTRQREVVAARQSQLLPSRNLFPPPCVAFPFKRQPPEG